MADAPDLGSGAARRGGSSPPSRIPIEHCGGDREIASAPLYASRLFGGQFEATTRRLGGQTLRFP